MEDLYNQDISNGKVGKEYKMETIDEKSSDYLRSFEYGQIKDKLTPGIEVKEQTGVVDHVHNGTPGQGGTISYNDLTDTPTAYAPKYYQVQYTAWVGAYTAGNFTVTCGFQPKKISILAASGPGQPGASEGYCVVDTGSSIKNGCKYNDGSYTNASNVSGTNVLLIKNGTQSTAGTVTSITSTGFIININNNNWNFNTIITVEG